MIYLLLFVKEFNWAVTILYLCDSSNIEDILYYLKDIGCPISLLREAEDLLEEKRLNTGFTYSNYLLRRSLIVINKTTSKELLFNTCVHECYHLIAHMTKNVKLSEEETATLIGNIFLQFCNKLLEI